VPVQYLLDTGTGTVQIESEQNFGITKKNNKKNLYDLKNNHSKE
jgi:hypothetical protein